MNDWRNLIHLDNCKEVIRLTMNDMIGIYMKELQYIEDGKKTLGLNPNNDDDVIALLYALIVLLQINISI